VGTTTAGARRHTAVMPTTDARAIVRALRGGPATLDALHARLGEPERESLGWAVDDAVARGWVGSSAGEDCRPDGVCSTSAPAVFTLTPSGREALRAAA
jgi:hypothetical protein